jgi:hypothetical protein
VACSVFHLIRTSPLLRLFSLGLQMSAKSAKHQASDEDSDSDTAPLPAKSGSTAAAKKPAADDEDDEYDEGEPTILLGVLEKPKNPLWLQPRFFPSKVGGKPVRISLFTPLRLCCLPASFSRVTRCRRG